MGFSTILSLLVFITIHFIISWWRQHRRYRSLPPGPTPLPFLGTPMYMDPLTADKDYTLLSQKYGSIFTLWKQTEPVVVLCGYETVKDALLNRAEEFSARPFLPTVHIPTKGYGKPFNPFMILSSALANIISSVLFGEHFDYKDPKLHDLISHTARHNRNITSRMYAVCNVFPFLLKLPLVQKTVFKENFYLQNLVLDYIKEHKRTLKPEAPRDFIDYFLLKIKEVEHEEDPDFCDLSLLNIIVGLLGGGSESTTSTAKFCLVFLAHYPDVQAKVQQEIDEVTQSLRPPTMGDRPQLPYTNATIHEIQRVLDLAPTAFFHAVTKDIQFRGHTIPKGTTIIPFLTSVLNDPSQWETPERFNPGHFLDEQGKFRNRVAFMPFSAGKRVCPGESLVRMELFLLLSALLQKFTFELPPGSERRDSKWLNANKRDITSNAQLCAVPRALPTK